MQHHQNAGRPKRFHVVSALAASLFMLQLIGCGVPDAPREEAAAPSVPAIRASRVFAGPGQYPPRDFAAYGILAFQSRATNDSRDRYSAICEGFVAGLPDAAGLEERGIPIVQQMATVWPLDDVDLADGLNAYTTGNSLIDRCGEIVSHIDIVTSDDALEAANAVSGTTRLDGVGPYLLAWSPSTAFGQTDIPVLVSDFSNVTNAELATRRFVDWRTQIQRNSELWRNGWDLDRVRLVIAEWADKYGAAVLRLFGV